MPGITTLPALTAFVLLMASVSSAQIGGGGSIQGTVLDPSHAALPGATVTATNVATGITTSRQTTDAGVYVLTPLQPGQYRVTVTLDGFQTFVGEGIIVDALSVVGLNVTMQLGGIRQEVVVTAAPLMLATADARLGQTIRNEVYTALPLVLNTGGPRDPTAFMFLMPGVTFNPTGGRWGNVMGGQDYTTDMYLEGIPITNAVVQGEGRNLSYGLSVDAIEQFQVETSGTAVMFNGQGASNYVVKSGTNTFRGGGFEYFRNKALDAKAFFANTKPDDNQHEYGGTLGGPIRRNRMFFFTAFDGYRDRRQTPSVLTSIPTLAERSGDFSALPVTIYDPRTTRPNPNGSGFVRDPFPGNIIPPDRISAISRSFQSFLPDPTNAGLQNNYLGGALPIGFNNDNLTGKVDLKPTSRQQVSVLFSHGKRSQSTPYRGGVNLQTALPLPYTETRLVEEAPTSAQVKHTYVLGTKWVNQASIGFSRLAVPIFNATIDGHYPMTAGLRGLPAGEADSSFPEIAFLGPNAPTQWRGTDSRAFTEYLNNYTLQNNLNWIHGKHAMTFGLQAQRMDANERERTYGSLATFGFSNAQTAGFSSNGTLQTTTGNAYAGFLLGELNATTVIQDSQVATSGRFYAYSFWGQDDFKVRPNLTLNLGLRYDILKPYTEVYDRWSFLDPTLPNAAVGGYPGAIVFAGDGMDSCHCRTPIKTYHAAIGPRLGVAYGLNDRTILRAAYGINYSRRGAVGGRNGARNGTGTLGFSANASFPSANGFDPAYNWNNGVPSYPAPPFFDPTLNAGFVAGRGTGGAVTYGDPEIGGRPPRYQNWNAGFQYALARTLTVGATYAGSRGDFLGSSGRGFYSNQLDPRYLVLGNLLTQPATPASIAAARAIVPGVSLPYPNFSGTIAQMLRPFPQYSGVSDVYGDVAWSRYHSLQLTVEKRQSDDGLIVSFNYTFSRGKDNLVERTGYNFAQDWSVGVNDQPHVWNAMVVYNVPLGAEGKPGSGNTVVRAIVKEWQISGITQFRSGRPLGSILAACNLPNAGTCYADYNPNFTGTARINGQYGDGDVLGANPPTYIDRAAFQSPAPFTYGNTPRTLAFDLRNPSSFNQDLSVRRDFRISRVKLGLGVDVFNVFNNVVFGNIQTNITSANFGKVSSQMNNPRVGQIKVRLEF